MAKLKCETINKTLSLPSNNPPTLCNTSITLILKHIVGQDSPQRTVSKQDWQNLTLGKRWNTSLNVFRICSKGALNTLSNQANYHKLGRVLNSPPLDAKCNMPIMRACKRVVMRLRVVGEKLSTCGKSGANSQGTREQKTLPQLILNQRLHITFKIGRQSPQ